MSQERAVRDAAANLAGALADAEAAGLRVIWPRTAAGLGALVISATARAIAPVVGTAVAQPDIADPAAPEPGAEPPAVGRRARRSAE